MGKDDGADVAAFHDHPTLSAELLLQADHPGAYRRKNAHARSSVGDGRIADQACHVLVIEQNAIFILAGIEADGSFGGELSPVPCSHPKADRPGGP